MLSLSACFSFFQTLQKYRGQIPPTTMVKNTAFVPDRHRFGPALSSTCVVEGICQTNPYSKKTTGEIWLDEYIAFMLISYLWHCFKDDTIGGNWVKDILLYVVFHNCRKCTIISMQVQWKMSKTLFLGLYVLPETYHSPPRGRIYFLSPGTSFVVDI